jgi:chromosome segregation ATPase
MIRLPRSIIGLTLALFCFAANGQLSLGIEALDHAFWISVKDSGDPKEFQEYLKVFPEGYFAGLAKIKVKSLRSEMPPTGQESGVVRKLKNDLKSLDKALVRARAEISKLAEQKAGLGEKLTTVTGEKEQLTGQKAALLITQWELKGQVESLQQTRTTLETTRETLQGEVAELVVTRDRLTSEKATQAALAITAQAQAQEATSLARARDGLSKERDELTTQVTLLEVTRTVLQTETSALRDELEGLLRSAVNTERALEESKLTRSTLQGEVAELVVTRDRLTSEVNRLGRPARSTVGRHVVEIRFWKEGNEYHYSLREPGQAVAQSVSLVELHQVLAALKAEYGDKLYTKVKFPNQDSMTQGEAWRFTVEIHDRYDYYYQN